MDLLDLPTVMTPEHENNLLAAVSDRWPGPPVSESDRLTRLMIATWEQVEGKTVNASYVATFHDMAKAVVADIEMRTDVLRTHVYALND